MDGVGFVVRTDADTISTADVQRKRENVNTTAIRVAVHNRPLHMV